MFQDLARGKLKESRLFNFMTAFIIKLLDLYPGEIKKTLGFSVNCKELFLGVPLKLNKKSNN
jgi:hypothetical protein